MHWGQEALERFEYSGCARWCCTTEDAIHIEQSHCVVKRPVNLHTYTTEIALSDNCSLGCNVAMALDSTFKR